MTGAPKIYDDYAGKLLDEVYSEIHTETPINFRNGLCGIGWGMEYLLQNNFLDGNSNEVLIGIDEKINSISVGSLNGMFNFVASDRHQLSL